MMLGMISEAVTATGILGIGMLALRKWQASRHLCSWCSEPLGDAQINGCCSERCAEEYADATAY